MARPPDGITAREIHFALRLSAGESKEIDRLRGQRTRSEYVRTLIRNAAKEVPDGRDTRRGPAT